MGLSISGSKLIARSRCEGSVTFETKFANTRPQNWLRLSGSESAVSEIAHFRAIQLTIAMAHQPVRAVRNHHGRGIPIENKASNHRPRAVFGTVLPIDKSSLVAHRLSIPRLTGLERFMV